MAYTPFGEFVRILRIKHHQVMEDFRYIYAVFVSCRKWKKEYSRRVDREAYRLLWPVTGRKNATRDVSRRIETPVQNHTG